MYNARRFGWNVQRLAQEMHHTDEELMEAIKINKHDLQRLYAGRLLLPYRDVKAIADVFGIPVIELISPDLSKYEKDMQRQYGPFANFENFDSICNIIDNYIDICDAIARPAN